MNLILTAAFCFILTANWIEKSCAKERRFLKREVEKHENLNLVRSEREASRKDVDFDDYGTYGLRSHKPKKIKYLESQIQKVENETEPNEHDAFDLKLPPGYDKYSIPKNSSGEPLNVFIQVNIRKILDFDELEESIKLDMTFRVLWTDHKIQQMHNDERRKRGEPEQTRESLTTEEVIAQTHTINDPHALDLIWKPNLFFENLLKVRQPYVMTAPITLKLIPEVGWFEYLTRISVVIDCSMEFHYYPADIQVCKFAIRPFSYTKKNMRLSWYRTGVWLHDLDLPSFDVQVTNLREFFLVEDDEDPNPDSFDILAFNIKTRRRLSYHLVQTYLASTFYIIITCLCFLLPARFVEARIGIAMTTLLTLTAMFAAVRESTPIVAYIKAIDIWMVGCIVFVFLTLAEFTFHTWLQAKKDDLEKCLDGKEKELISFTQRTKEKDYSIGKNGDAEDAAQTVQMLDLRMRKDSATPTLCAKSAPVLQHPCDKNNLNKYSKWLRIMDNYGFYFFITLIAVYTIIYWTWLLVAAKYFDWTVDPENNNINGTDNH